MARTGASAEPTSTVVLYRFRSTWRRRRAGYLGLALLLAVLGGVAMAAIAGARRTQSSYPAFLRHSKTSDLGLAVAVYDPETDTGGYSPDIVAQVRQLPRVVGVGTWAALNVLPLGPDGTPSSSIQPQAGGGSGSVDGLYWTQDLMTIVDGQLPDPDRPDEFAANQAGADQLGVQVGDVVSFGIYTNAQTAAPDFATGAQVPYERLDIRLAGIATFNGDVVRDDDDIGGSFLQFTPALTNQLLDCCVSLSGVQLRLDHGAQDVPAVEDEIRAAAPPGQEPQFTETAVTTAKAERALEPESIALGVFGGIVALAALTISVQMIGRLLDRGADDAAVLRSLGASPRAIVGDTALGVAAAVVIGALTAAALAVALSPLAPIGVVRTVEPSPGFAIDWTVVGIGTAALVVLLGAVGLALAWRRAPQRAARHRLTSTRAGSRLVRGAVAVNLPSPAIIGIGFAVEPGVGRDRVPVRSAILSAALAVMVLVGAVTFGASLNGLVSHPARYGWNWDDEVLAGGGNTDLPQDQVAALLAADADVAAWSGVWFSALPLDGHSVPVIATDLDPDVAPPLLSGHGLDAADEVVLGPATLARLHKHVGDTVAVELVDGTEQALRIVGTATMPTIGVIGNDHTTMGTGALVAASLLSDDQRNPLHTAVTGPNAILVRLRHGVDKDSATRSLAAIANATSTASDWGVTVLPLQRPAEIVNYRNMKSTPAILAVALAAGALAALALTLLASVKRRRRDLALLKILGHTRHQPAAILAWQSSVAVGLGAVVGVPAGIVVGRILWDLFAHSISAVPRPNIPGGTIVLIVVSALVLANVVASIPGRQAARTPALLLLRAD